MNMRCKICNKQMTQNELCFDKRSTGLDCDTCAHCRLASASEYNMAYDHEYEHNLITEREGGATGSKAYWGEYYYS